MLELMAYLKMVTERGTSQGLWESTAVPGFFKKLAEADLHGILNSFSVKVGRLN